MTIAHLTPGTAAPALAALRAALLGGGRTPAAADALISAYTAEHTAGVAAVARSMWADPRTTRATAVLAWLDTLSAATTAAHTADTDHQAAQLLGAGDRFERRYSCMGDVRRGGTLQLFPRHVAVDIVHRAMLAGDQIETDPDGSVVITYPATGHQERLTALALAAGPVREV